MRQLQVEAYDALEEDDDVLTKLPCYMTAVEGLSSLIGYFNYNQALELRLDYMETVYRISESYVLAGTPRTFYCSIY